MSRIRSVHPGEWPDHSKWAGTWGHVYVISEDGGPVKIGYARNAFWRLIQLQIGNPRKLEMRGVIWCEERSMAARLEKLTKAEFVSRNIRGEWYDVDPQTVIDFLEGHVG